MANSVRNANIAFGSVALATVAVLVLSDSTSAPAIALMALSVGVTASVVFGARKFRPRTISTWILPLAAIASFLVGDAIRNSSGYADLNGSVVPDLFTLAAYCALLVSTVKNLHPRSILGGNVDAYLDLASVIVSGILVSWTLLVVPALSSPRWPTGVKATIVAIYPMLDVVLLVVLVYSLSTTGPAGRALRLMQLSVGTVVIGNLAISATAAGLVDLSDGALLAPYVLGIVAYGFAALQPSMTEIGARPPIDPDKLRQRAMVISVTLLAAVLVTITGSFFGTTDNAMTAPWLAALILLVLFRSERAIRRSEKNERRAVARADRDPLTGLPNRAVLMRELDDMAKDLPRCVLFIDLNGFKSVNDTYGHDVGDQLLTLAGQRVRTALRANDVVARFGGDEFVVISNEPRDHVMPFAQRIAQVIDTPFLLDVGELSISASIGVATAAAGEKDVTSDSMLRRADLAMYQAKEIGDGMIVFFDELTVSEDELLRRRRDDVSDLRDTVDRDAPEASAEDVAPDNTYDAFEDRRIERNQLRRIQ